MSYPDLVPLPEAARDVRVSPQTLRNYVAGGKLTEYRRGKRLLIDRAELRQHFEPLRVPVPRGEGARIIAVANQKGGTAKTTTVHALGAILGRRHPTLLVDMNPQADLTTRCGFLADALERTVYNVLFDGVRARDAVRRVESTERLDLLPSNVDLSAAALRMMREPVGIDVMLRDALRDAADAYAFVLIDCPPSLDLLTINALAAATDVLVPVALDGPAPLRLTTTLVELIRQVQRVNVRLGAPLFLATRARRDTVSRALLEEMERKLVGRVFQTVIRNTNEVAKYQFVPGASLPDAAPGATASQDYEALAEEILRGP